MFFRDYIFLAALASITGVDAFSIAIRMPSVLSKGAGGGGSGSGGGGGGSHHSTNYGYSFSSSAMTGRGSSGDTGHPAVTSFSGPGSNTRVSNYFSSGGGNPLTLPSTSAFAGRKMGGGVRVQVIGTPRYASGYPYSVSTSEYDRTRRGVLGQPFPFGFYPIYWGYHGYGGEYVGGEGQDTSQNVSVIAERPGGNLSYARIVSKVAASYATPSRNNTYWIIGDYESVNTILSLLVDPVATHYGCDAENSTILPFITVSADGGPIQYHDPFSNNTNATLTNSTLITNGTALPFRFENVIQWYRASSFALVFPRYNNTFASLPLNETTDPSDWANSTPIPKALQSSFLKCVNKTIYSSLPILDADLKVDPRLSTAEIVGIVFGSIFGALALAGVGFMVWRKYIKDKQKKAYKAVAMGDERKTDDGSIVHDSERTMVEDEDPPTYTSKPLIQDAK